MICCFKFVFQSCGSAMLCSLDFCWAMKRNVKNCHVWCPGKNQEGIMWLLCGCEVAGCLSLRLSLSLNPRLTGVRFLVCGYRGNPIFECKILKCISLFSCSPFAIYYDISSFDVLPWINAFQLIIIKKNPYSSLCSMVTPAFLHILIF